MSLIGGTIRLLTGSIMHTSSRLAIYASLAIATAGCASSIEVRTMEAPDAGLSALHTFRMLPGPARRDGRPVTGADDPMISNSIANRAIRERIVKALQGHGYAIKDQGPDFAVAFYATTRTKLDVTVWDYGYPFSPGWPRRPIPQERVVPYTEGSVIIDVINPATKTLLWRGEGKATLSDDPSENVKQLSKAAEAIIGKLPHATNRVEARP